MTMNTDCIVERLDIFKNQFICMSVVENFKTVNRDYEKISVN